MSRHMKHIPCQSIEISSERYLWKIIRNDEIAVSLWIIGCERAEKSSETVEVDCKGLCDFWSHNATGTLSKSGIRRLRKQQYSNYWYSKEVSFSLSELFISSNTFYSNLFELLHSWLFFHNNGLSWFQCSDPNFRPEHVSTHIY